MSDELNEQAENEQADSQEAQEEQFEKTPDEVTGFGGKGKGKAPPWFDRRKVLMVICGAFIFVVLLGVVFGSGRSRRKGSDGASGWAASVPRSFLQGELERSLREQGALSEMDALLADLQAGRISQEEYDRRMAELLGDTDEYGLPRVTAIPPPARPPPIQQQVPPPGPGPGQASNERQPQPQLSSLLPRIEGNLDRIASSPSQQPQGQGYDDGYAAYLAQRQSVPDYGDLFGALSGLEQGSSYDMQNNQANKQAFYSGETGGAVSGNFLPPNILWIGTVIPAVLVTAINTDLPGNIIARVTQNIYDSRTGRNLLIPQGTLLVAQYNSSVSYAQRRIQVAWDILIRPDGYQIELEGMNGVDARGMAGLKAVYRENWFEYVKAAGIISMFSLLNGVMAEQVARFGTDEMAAALVASNAEFIRDIGGNLISRALDIQPTLTLESGSVINVMLNKNVFLPPVRDNPVTERYILR